MANDSWSTRGPAVQRGAADRRRQLDGGDPEITVQWAHGHIAAGSEYTWIPADTLEGIGIKREKKDLAFLMANGQTVTRSTGFAIVRIGEAFTVDEVVFGEPRGPGAAGRPDTRRYEPDRRPPGLEACKRDERGEPYNPAIT